MLLQLSRSLSPGYSNRRLGVGDSHGIDQKLCTHSRACVRVLVNAVKCSDLRRIQLNTVSNRALNAICFSARKRQVLLLPTAKRL